MLPNRLGWIPGAWSRATLFRLDAVMSVVRFQAEESYAHSLSNCTVSAGKLHSGGCYRTTLDGFQALGIGQRFFCLGAAISVVGFQAEQSYAHSLSNSRIPAVIRLFERL